MVKQLMFFTLLITFLCCSKENNTNSNKVSNNQKEIQVIESVPYLKSNSLQVIFEKNNLLKFNFKNLFDEQIETATKTPKFLIIKITKPIYLKVVFKIFRFFDSQSTY